MSPVYQKKKKKKIPVKKRKTMMRRKSRKNTPEIEKSKYYGTFVVDLGNSRSKCAFLDLMGNKNAR